MVIILSFVNNHGILTERFFAIKSVSDTTSLNLKKDISNVLVHYDIQVKKIRGQGYGGASNMCGEWNGLQALFLRDCPYAYYVHCFAHRLQLTLVSAAKDVSVIWEFFSHLDNIVNIVTSSTKRIAELHTAQEMKLSICWKLENVILEVEPIRLSDDICKLEMNFYPEDFTDQDVVALENELVHYKLDVMQNLKVSTLVELCQQLTDSGRSKVYVMLNRLIHLVLTLHVSTVTTKRDFSAMKHVKTALRNKMKDDFLADCLTLYIERYLTKDIDVDSILDKFYVLKSRRAQLL
ncbi:uncharacterized protein [Henckelia pumila]|uniref:uncharacterized protein n=1 Tax=Henckelia pumila TaxID=405737 RepID=UPI003C6DF572